MKTLSVEQQLLAGKQEAKQLFAFLSGHIEAKAERLLYVLFVWKRSLSFDAAGFRGIGQVEITECILKIRTD